MKTRVLTYSIIIITALISITGLAGCAGDPLNEDFHSSEDFYMDNLYLTGNLTADGDISAEDLTIDDMTADDLTVDDITADDINMDDLTADNITGSDLLADNITSTEGNFTTLFTDQAGSPTDNITDLYVQNLYADNVLSDNVTQVEQGAPLAHASTHEWGDTDEANIKDLMTLKNPGLYYNTGDASYTLRLNGSGGGGGNAAYTSLFVTAGAVANDNAGLTQNGAWWFSHGSINHRYRYNGSIQNSTNTNIEIWTGFFPDTITYPTPTSNHVGFYYNSGNLTATNGNGVAGKQTLIAGGIGSWSNTPVGFEYMENDITYYLNNGATAVATHTTNRPNNVNMYNGIWVKGLTTNSPLAWFFGQSIMVGGE